MEMLLPSAVTKKHDVPLFILFCRNEKKNKKTSKNLVMISLKRISELGLVQMMCVEP